MTIRRTKNREDGYVEVVEEPITNPYLRLLLGTNGWKLIIILLLATMHPIGRSLLSGFGFEFPDTKKITEAASNANAAKSDLMQIAESVKEIKQDVAGLKQDAASLKANNTILNAKVDTLSTDVQGFKIDFSKWRPKEEPK